MAYPEFKLGMLFESTGILKKAINQGVIKFVMQKRMQTGSGQSVERSVTLC